MAVKNITFSKLFKVLYKCYSVGGFNNKALTATIYVPSSANGEMIFAR
jgi:hypothetical protein